MTGLHALFYTLSAVQLQPSKYLGACTLHKYAVCIWQLQRLDMRQDVPASDHSFLCSAVLPR